MFISKTSFINWTRCSVFIPMDLKYNPPEKKDINEERENCAKMLEEMRKCASSSDAIAI